MFKKIIILIKLFAIYTCFANISFLFINALPHNHYVKTIKLEPICTDNETGKKLLVGEAMNRINKCTRIQCIGDEKIWQYECNVPNLDGDCQQIESPNPSGMYPECCPRYLCIKQLSDDQHYIEKTIYDQYGNQIKKSVTRIIKFTSFDQNNGNMRVPYDVVR